ncbi:hypothetical protein ACFQDF_04655 [Ectobacillus funiculus]
MNIHHLDKITKINQKEEGENKEVISYRIYKQATTSRDLNQELSRSLRLYNGAIHIDYIIFHFIR